MAVAFTSYDLRSSIALGSQLRHLAALPTLSQTAQSIVELFDSQFRFPGTQDPGLVLARLFITRRFSKLSPAQAEFASSQSPHALLPSTPCLTLLGSTGRLPSWCDPAASVSYKAMPLFNLASVEGLPMVWRMFEQLGIDIPALIENRLPHYPQRRRDGLDTFHIERAESNRWIPGQSFVREHKVSSALAIGSLLPDGELAILLLFSREPIRSNIPPLCRPLGINLELALLPHLGLSAEQVVQSRLAAFQQLLAIKDALIHQQVSRMEALLTERDAAIAQAEQQLEVRTALIRNVRHEFRTPLNGLVGALDILKLSPRLDDADRNLTNIAQNSALGALHILDNFIEYADIASARRSIFPTSLSLRPFLHELIAGMRSQGPRLDWFLDVAPSVPPQILIDSDALASILRQLLDNALKFTHAGSVTLRVEPLPDCSLRFTLTDSGIGIPPDKLHLIFEPLRQADSSTTRRHEGIGMGLAIARELTSLLNGILSCESTPGRGSCFSLTLPLS